MNLKDIDTEELKNELVRRGYIRAFWMQEDIRSYAEGRDYFSITDEDVKVIAKNIEDNHDAEVGINWGVIHDYIHDRLRYKAKQQ